MTTRETPRPHSGTATPAVAVIIPALNEAAGLRKMLPELRAASIEQIIVADNGSADDTAAVAREHGACVVHEPRRGYGAACWAGMHHLTERIQIVVFMDADGSDDPRLLPRMIEPIATDRADFVIGCRAGPLCEPGAMTLQQRFGNALATSLIRWRWGHRYRDLGPFRAIRRAALDQIGMRDRAFGWTVEMQIRAIQEHLRIEEIDVPYRRRVGQSKISGTLRGTVLAAYWILTTVSRLSLGISRRRVVK